ncbi:MULTISPECIES: DUF3574 domain-containing protein [unclassified Brenneria]|uniref:DUF3574 domain-containing protein n=1 Tax=unclassified Brenneria TaxID=2634434 RepID=UPI0029C42FE6|nr:MULTISPECIES: DUF3574 domain-containing protein [unclassified Brenneria]MDX5629785.1 DUF3574 domain-containing protein [Brenneria sp. L3-3Z]MDX5696931.1 DUF3574 domain-containing protein [Brenneria sp. L4-2C]MEE3663947.1 DUF3574 domain-containing protein [Brenneria sp. g21c3]
MTRKPSIYFVASLLLGAFFTSGCAPSLQTTDASYRCHLGDESVQTTLYFGLSRPAGPPVSAAEWQAFVDSVVTPRFKAGLTVFDAQGQWLGDNGAVVRENSKALLLIHGAEQESDIEALRAEYKARFAQESVMRVDAPACVAF